MCKYADNVFYGHGININKSEANKYYKMFVDKRNSDAMYKYANNLFNGDEIDINKSEANKSYKMSADKGNTNAINKLNLL